jgi:hypothetical protein
MLFKKISRNDGDKLFIVVKNVSGGVMTAGYSCCFDLTAADGVRVTQPATAFLQAYAGVIDSDIADSGYGLCQVYGYRSSAYILRSTAKTSAAGEDLAVTNGEWALLPVIANTNVAFDKSFAFLCETVSSSTGTSYVSAKVFVRAL